MEKSPIGWMLTPFQRALDLKGRARRAEYWWFTLLWMLLAGAALAVDIMILGVDAEMPAGGSLFLLLCVLLLVPHLAVSVRRLHDQNLSGWFFLVGFIPYAGILMLLWWMTRPGTAGDNRFGPDPLPPPDNPTLYY